MVIFTVLVKKVVDKAVLLEKNKSRAEHFCSTTDLQKQPIPMFALHFCIVSTKKKKKKATFDMSTTRCLPFKLHEQKGDLLAQMFHTLKLSVKLMSFL